MKITEAAIKTPDGKIWSVPRPGRHDSVIKLVTKSGGKDVIDATQGFVNEEGAFLTRAEAEVVARASGQLKGSIIGGELTSEDLWNSWRCGYDVNTKTHGHGCGHHYERPLRPRGKAHHRRHSRVNPARTTTCPACGRKDALNPSLRR